LWSTLSLVIEWTIYLFLLCQITDGFTLEDKGVAKLVIPEDRAPKTIITTNYTIDASARSDRRRLWFVPISTYYGEQQELTGKTPADFL